MNNIATGVGANAAAPVVCYALGPGLRNTLPISAEGAQRERMTNMEKVIDAVRGDCFFLLDTSSRACSTLPLSAEQARGPCKRVKRTLMQCISVFFLPYSCRQLPNQLS